MPELPEVETVCRQLRSSSLIGSSVQGIHVSWPRSVGGDAVAFARAVAGNSFTAVNRRGKFIVLLLTKGSLLIHLRMSGYLSVCPAGEAPRLHDRVRLVLSGEQELRFHDPRKFGRFLFCDDVAAKLASLGPEPLTPEWNAELLCRILGPRKRQIKALLLDQHAVAGLGNIYVDEALWMARIHPQRLAASLTEIEVTRLADTITTVLTEAISHGGTQLGSGVGNFGTGTNGPTHQEALRVFHRPGQPCPRCGEAIIRTVIASRGTHICPQCQPCIL